jgi:hypothetical protein
LSRQELRLTNLVTTDLIADLLPPPGEPGKAMADAKQPDSKSFDSKPLLDRHASDIATAEPSAPKSKPTKTAEAALPTGGLATPPAQPQQ